VVVDDEQLSLAIGKKGQNVRLASRLVGWKIDIKSEQEKKREVEAEIERMARDAREMESLQSVGEKTVQRLVEAGYRSLDAIAEAQVEGLTQVSGIGPKTAEKVLVAAQELLEVRLQREEAERLRLEQEAAVEAEAAAAAEAAASAEAEAAAAEAAGTETAEDGTGASAGPPASEAESLGDPEAHEPDDAWTREESGSPAGALDKSEQSGAPRPGADLAESPQESMPASGPEDGDSGERREDD